LQIILFILDAAVYLAAILEYLSAEMLELSGQAAMENECARIMPRHITLGVRNDNELDELLGNVVIAEGGVKPHIEQVLLPKLK
jgi:histone H2A